MQLSGDLRPREPAAQGRVGDAVVAGEPPQRFSRGPSAHELGIRRQPPQPGPIGYGGGVVECARQDRGVDRAQDVLARAQSGRFDHRLDATTCLDSALGQLIVPAAQIGAEQRQTRVTLIQPSRIRRTGRPTRGGGRRRMARPRVRKRRLLFRPPAYRPLRPALRDPPRRRRPPLAPLALARLAQLPRQLWSREVAAERRVRHPVVGRKRAQRLARRPSAHKLSIGHQPAQTTMPLHLPSLSD